MCKKFLCDCFVFQQSNLLSFGCVGVELSIDAKGFKLDKFLGNLQVCGVNFIYNRYQGTISYSKRSY